MTRKEALEALLAKVEAGEFWAEMLRPPELHTDLCWKAYKGSLDAAKALHEAVLPGCGRAVDATMPEAGICVEIHKEAQFIGTGDTTCEARAWLIAIIKALISMEPEA